VSPENLKHEAACTFKSAPPTALERELGGLSLCESVENEQASVLVSRSDTDTGDEIEEGDQLVDPIDEESEFGDTELNKLVLEEGPQQILQLTLQDQADGLMKEELSDTDDYANWLLWVSDAEERRHVSKQPEQCTKAPGMFQIDQVTTGRAHVKQPTDCRQMSTRWEEISQKIKIDHNLRDGEKH
jgi:hypothetical protein